MMVTSIPTAGSMESHHGDRGHLLHCIKDGVKVDDAIARAESQQEVTYMTLA